MGNLVLPAGSNVNHVIDDSLMFNTADTVYLSKTPASGHLSKWTFSAWIKRGKISGINQYLLSSGTGSGNFTGIRINEDDALEFINWDASIVTIQLTSDALFRDTSAWMHIHVIYDSANATDADRVIMSVNGARITDLSTENKAALNEETFINDNITHQIGGTPVATRIYDGYMAEVAFIGGSAYSADYFGETHPDCPTIWRPISIAGLDYSGVNSFHLNFADNSSVAALGYDVSGNSFNWNVTGIITTDQSDDTPTNNACIANPLDVPDLADIPTISEGNRRVKSNQSTNYHAANASFGVSSGKWYFEYKVTFITAENYSYIGVIHESDLTQDASSGEQWAFNHDGLGGAYKRYQGSSTYIPGFGNLVVGDIMQCAFDMDTGKIWFGARGSWAEGDPSAGTGESFSSLYGTVLPRLLQVGFNELVVNFTEDSFVYTPPTGFKALTSKNLPAPVIPDSKKYFYPILYTGNSVTDRVIPTENKVDHVVIKARDAASVWSVVDTKRGVGQEINWGTTGAESTESETVKVFGAVSGFTIGSNYKVNLNGISFLALPFTDNAIAGMDIVLYTGTGVNRTIAHSLGVVPEMMIVKQRSGSLGWRVFHVGMGSPLYILDLSAASARASSALYWNSTNPTASVFSVGTANSTNLNAGTFINYLFASVEGFSKVFKYIGTANATYGPYVHCGFKPAFILFKNSTGAYGWVTQDIVRDPENPSNLYLTPNFTSVEASNIGIDFLANGFKIRDSTNRWNQLSATVVGIAFAEYPFALLNNAEL